MPRKITESSKSILYGLMIVALLCCSSASCQDAEMDTAWSYPHYDEGCRSLMKGLHAEWIKADGEGAFEVGRLLFWALLLDPNAFYKELSPDTTYFQRFVDEVDVLVFRNFNDTTTAHLERLRIVAIDRLTEKTYGVSENYQPLHKELIETLRLVKVTYVD
jgi:hypothetical protein